MNACRFWPARRDSNPRPSESESAAISSFATGGCADIIAQKKAGSKSGGRAARKYFSDGQQNWKKLLQKSEVSLIIYELLIFSATVAQLVEQLIRNQQVAGSSPASSSNPQSFVYQGLAGFSFARNSVRGRANFRVLVFVWSLWALKLPIFASRKRSSFSRRPIANLAPECPENQFSAFLPRNRGAPFGYPRTLKLFYCPPVMCARRSAGRNSTDNIKTA